MYSETILQAETPPLVYSDFLVELIRRRDMLQAYPVLSNCQSLYKEGAWYPTGESDNRE
jgi:hypothetical protein